MSYVLLVEDDPPLRKLVSRWLQGAGYGVKCASTGAEALELLSAEAPSIMLCDFGLPDQNGCGLVEQARAQIPNLSVVMMTGGPIPAYCACTAVLEKPFGRAALVTALRARAPRVSCA